MTERVTPDVRATQSFERMRTELERLMLSRLDTLEEALLNALDCQGHRNPTGRALCGKCAAAAINALAGVQAAATLAEPEPQPTEARDKRTAESRPTRLDAPVPASSGSASAEMQAPAPENSTSAPLAPTGEAGGREADARHKTSLSVQAPAGEVLPMIGEEEGREIDEQTRRLNDERYRNP